MPATVGVNAPTAVPRAAGDDGLPTSANADPGGFRSRTEHRASSDTDKWARKPDGGNPPVPRTELRDGAAAIIAGSAGGGVVSNKIKGKAEFVNHSFDVKFEGKGVARALDLMLHNDKNTPPFPVVQGPVVPIPPIPKPNCDVCDEEFDE
jgi:hypothetical protein